MKNKKGVFFSFLLWLNMVNSVQDNRDTRALTSILDHLPKGGISFITLEKSLY